MVYTGYTKAGVEGYGGELCSAVKQNRLEKKGTDTNVYQTNLNQNFQRKINHT